MFQIGQVRVGAQLKITGCKANRSSTIEKMVNKRLAYAAKKKNSQKKNLQTSFFQNPVVRQGCL